MMVDLQTISLVVQMIGVSATATAAVIGVNSYINSNKRAEEAKKKEQETRNRELETRQAQLFMQVFNRYDAEFFKNYIIVMNKDYKSFDEWMSDRSDPIISPARVVVATYFNGIGILVKSGLVSVELLLGLIGGPLVMWWDNQSKYMMEYRVKANWPSYMRDAEYLYGEIVRLRGAGFSPPWKV